MRSMSMAPTLAPKQLERLYLDHSGPLSGPLSGHLSAPLLADPSSALRKKIAV
ncbi:hypothetical protein SODALDRAFT_360450 [Sodiomyces alkalinus F11]|uniref:Uncharacterized protein n=1 Tax=Sodiomyces alkalinus (strain CBS 110278 / VKM F-3762 / F11) TaxID=1314773 RepID=A0A3N2PUD5_SODAK|nr:hypothetical protein SODALDRAFT_360450 [Sodiomyces alkalinus F11]ROT38115.1 hypothetical protein SODALDRAFT_360450 [Sodiomyces alkalinus F11]